MEVKSDGEVLNRLQILHKPCRYWRWFISVAAFWSLTAGIVVANPTGNHTDSTHWLSPIDGFNVIRTFGAIDKQTGRANRGADVVATDNSFVVAPADGLITVSAQADPFHPEHRDLIVIDHGNGVQTLFSDLGTRNVVVNQWVRKGQRIGTVRETNCTGYGATTHIEVIVNGTPIDPFKKLPYMFFDLILQP